MKNVTLAFDDTTLALGKTRAKHKGTSFNAYVRELIIQDTHVDNSWLNDTFELMDKHPVKAATTIWTRDDLHAR